MSTQALTELLHGKGAQADPAACVEDVSPDLANSKVQGFPHSIADLVFHMNYWMDYELRRSRGQKPKHPEHNSESFLAEAVEPTQWRQLQEQFAALLAELVELGKSPRQELDRQLESIHAGDMQVAGTLESVLWQMVAHNSYHTGQIALIRRALGAWPPRQGGDTW